jgi:hypothetical protein
MFLIFNQDIFAKTMFCNIYLCKIKHSIQAKDITCLTSFAWKEANEPCFKYKKYLLSKITCIYLDTDLQIISDKELILELYFYVMLLCQ